MVSDYNNIKFQNWKKNTHKRPESEHINPNIGEKNRLIDSQQMIGG